MFLPKQPEFYTLPNWVAGISCLSVLVLIVHVIGFIAPYWGVFEISSFGITTTVYYGLWSTCTSVSTDRTVCIDWTSSTSSDALKASQFFGVTGMLTAIMASLMFVLIALKNMMSKLFVIADITLFFVSAVLNICTIISFIVTIAKTADSDWLSWGFVLVCINTVTCALIGGYILLFSKKRGIIFQKPRRMNDNTEPPMSTRLSSSKKIKVIKVQETPKMDEEELQTHKEIIESKII